MLYEKILYAYDDVMIEPNRLSRVSHRDQCNVFCENGKLPIFTAPMSTVVNEKNFDLFETNKINAILPRSIDLKTRLMYAQTNRWAAFSLQEFEEHFCNENNSNTTNHGFKVLIDVANGHMMKLYYLVKEAKSIYGDYITIMVGNIANPETYHDAYEAGVDYIRIGVGAGNGCITSSNLGIHYGMASLISDVYKTKQWIIDNTPRHKSLRKLPYIVADGGIRNYSDVIKALALGADYVMIGSVFSSLIESAAKTFTYDKNGDVVSFEPLGTDTIREFGDGVFDVNDGTHIINDLYKVFYGMASRYGQIDINGKKTKTSEGIRKILPVTTNIDKWSENMIDYLRSAMSYTDVTEIKDFNPKRIVCNIISNNTKQSINK